MKYQIVSEAVGVPGEEYTPAEGVNVEALLIGGFIVEVSTDKPTKQRKVISDPEE
jgi:hypothetical protein